MNPAEMDQRLSRIATHWTMLWQAHGSADDPARQARAVLVQRYHGAAFRYLLGALGDPEAAEELCQEFAVRVLRGDFHRANPERGRFRDYLKMALVNLVNDHHRARAAAPRPFAPDAPDPAAPEQSLLVEQDFTQRWREELLDRTWTALQAATAQGHAVLRARIAHPELSSAQLAEQLTQQGQPITAANVRKTLERAHAKFADLLLDEVACSLETTDADAIAAELRELDLWKYCGPALQRWREKRK